MRRTQDGCERCGACIDAPDDREPVVTNGIAPETAVPQGIRGARAALESESPDRVITIGGNCIVSLAPFDYLHAIYPDAGIIWIDAHPDVSLPENGYPNAHAMVLSTLLGDGSAQLVAEMKAPAGNLKLITENAEVPGFEYLPFEAERLQHLFAGISFFTEKSEAKDDRSFSCWSCKTMKA